MFLFSEDEIPANEVKEKVSVNKPRLKKDKNQKSFQATADFHNNIQVEKAKKIWEDRLQESRNMEENSSRYFVDHALELGITVLNRIKKDSIGIDMLIQNDPDEDDVHTTQLKAINMCINRPSDPDEDVIEHWLEFSLIDGDYGIDPDYYYKLWQDMLLELELIKVVDNRFEIIHENIGKYNKDKLKAMMEHSDFAKAMVDDEDVAEELGLNDEEED